MRPTTVRALAARRRPPQKVLCEHEKHASDFYGNGERVSSVCLSQFYDFVPAEEAAVRAFYALLGSWLTYAEKD